MIKRYIILLALCLCSAGFLFSATLNPDQALKAGKNFMKNISHQYQPESWRNWDEASLLPVMESGKLLYYVLNYAQGGYILLSAHEQLKPVIAYSLEGRFDPENMPPQTRYFLEGITEEITYHLQNKSTATDAIQQEWDHLLSNSTGSLALKGGRDISPLLLCNWDQGKYYNELCPADAGGDGGHVFVGCVATAMAQVMFYYRYPQQGIGSNTYNHPQYGSLSANFGNTTYPWTGMLNSLISSNHPVALLSYHCGVAVNMNFGPDGSGANTASVAGALKQNFGYANSTQHVQRMSYSVQGWIDLFKENLDQLRPCVYSGHPSGGGAGHAWVVDGYQANNYFHMNWGWSGSSNGYFTLDNLNPAGAGNFNSGHGAIVGIYPGAGYPPACAGQVSITGHTTGTIEDGSGTGDYNNNLDCSWLIAPLDSVKSLKITFHRFDTEQDVDRVRIYAGYNTAAPLLGEYSGSNLPAVLNHNGSVLLITFQSDSANTGAGWYLTYSATYPQFCANTALSAPAGSITDGSGNKPYSPSSICTWIIQPPNVAAITLTFTEFETEPNNDYVRVYDLNTQELLGTFSGSALPPTVTTSTGGMYIEFRSNGATNLQGWTANYASLGAGLVENPAISRFSVYPNPVKQVLHLAFTTEKTQHFTITLSDAIGKTILHDSKENVSGEFKQTYALPSLAKGVYMLHVRGELGLVSQKVIVQ